MATIKTLPCGCTLIKDESAHCAPGIEAWIGGDVCQMHQDEAAANAITSAAQQAKQEKLMTLMREHIKLTYRIMVYADPASTAGKKSNAMAYIQEKRAWIEANIAELQDLLS